MLRDSKYTRKGEKTTFLCGKAQCFLSKIPDARGITASSMQVGAGATQLPFCLSRTVIRVQEACS